MKSIVEEIYLGKIGSAENLKLYKDYGLLSEDTSKAMDLLLAVPDENQKNLLNEALSALLSECSAESTHAYAAGFRLGILIGIESASLKDWL